MSALVIVAIPSQDDIVWKLSSEEVPHLTLLYLGETGSGQNVAQIATYLEHAASRSLARFSLDVDRRGTLGKDDADVLFFSKSKWSGFESMKEFRHFLLQDPSIRAAYDAAEQYPEWNPHLTMGYPDKPAKKDDRDYPGIHYVSFDRIALWFGNYDGIEFALKNYDWDMEVAMSAVEEGYAAVQNVLGLKHYGVKGMKWGKRKSPEERASRKANKKDQKWVAKNHGIPIAQQKRGDFRSKVDKQVILPANKAAKKRAKEINKKPEYVAAKKRGDLKNPDLDITKKYEKEQLDAWKDEMNKAFNSVPANLRISPSGKLQAKLTITKTGNWAISVKEARHAAGDLEFEVKPVRDADGMIVDLVMVESDDTLEQMALRGREFLEHYGVKGMRWGVRGGQGTPTAVSVQDKGKKLKTSGGQNQPAHKDAVNARSLGQQGKASGLKTLSNKDLQDYATRLRLEQEVKRLEQNEKPAVKKFIAQLLGQTAKQQASSVVQQTAAQQVAGVLKKK